MVKIQRHIPKERKRKNSNGKKARGLYQRKEKKMENCEKKKQVVYMKIKKEKQW